MFEQSIRMPIGPEFNPVTTIGALNRPEVRFLLHIYIIVSVPKPSFFLIRALIRVFIVYERERRPKFCFLSTLFLSW